VTFYNPNQDIAARPPRYSEDPTADLLLEQEFSNFLRQKAMEDGVALVPFSTPSGQSQLVGVIQEKPATAWDAIDFVTQQQDQQERQFFASQGNAMKGVSKAQYEDVLLRQYQNDYINVDQALRMLLTTNALDQEQYISPVGRVEDLYIY